MRFLMLFALALTLPADAQESAPQQAAAIEVSPDAIELSVGESLQLDVVVRDAAGEVVEDALVLYLPEWGQFWNLGARTWGFNLFSVSADGLVTASKAGEYGIRVRVPVGDAEFIDRLVPLHIVEPPIAEVTIVDAPQVFYAGTNVRLQTQYLDASGAVRTNVAGGFRSSDAEVAEVDAVGNVRLLAPGSVTLTATAEGAATSLEIDVVANPAARLQLQAPQSTVRTGDVVRLDAQVLTASGDVVPGAPVTYSFLAATDRYAAGGPSSGLMTADGRFVADLPGEYTLLASSGSVADRLTVIVEPRGARREIELVGHGRVSEYGTSDLWVWEGVDGRDYAITGTHRGEGLALFWDVTDPASIEMINSVKVDARNVNDVKVTADGRVAVISREGASNRRNGLVILDVTAPREQVEILASYDDQLTGGVHNLFLYEDHVYALSGGQRYDIINIEDPTAPHRVSSFQLPNHDRAIHDVWVVDGIAYSANWNDGVVLVDVGGGGLGGSPRNPVMMGQLPFDTGWNHAVFPYRSASTGRHYVFAGDEAARSGSFSPEPEVGTGTPGYEREPDRWRGWIHILEWEPGSGDEPRLVGRYEVPEAGSHNIWVEDDVMYVAFYNGGLRVVDVSGELLGDLYRQGREIARFLPFDPEVFN